MNAFQQWSRQLSNYISRSVCEPDLLHPITLPNKDPRSFRLTLIFAHCFPFQASPASAQSCNNRSPLQYNFRIFECLSSAFRQITFQISLECKGKHTLIQFILTYRNKHAKIHRELFIILRDLKYSSQCWRKAPNCASDQRFGLHDVGEIRRLSFLDSTLTNWETLNYRVTLQNVCNMVRTSWPICPLVLSGVRPGTWTRVVF